MRVVQVNADRKKRLYLGTKLIDGLYVGLGGVTYGSVAIVPPWERREISHPHMVVLVKSPMAAGCAL